MNSVLKARVMSGRYKGQTVRITNVSLDDSGKKKAAVFLEDGSRANIMADELEIIQPEALRKKSSVLKLRCRL